MRQRVLGLVDALRGHEVPVSVAESLDAIAAVAVAGVERDVLREALATTLVKDEHERPTSDPRDRPRPPERRRDRAAEREGRPAADREQGRTAERDHDAPAQREHVAPPEADAPRVATAGAGARSSKARRRALLRRPLHAL